MRCKIRRPVRHPAQTLHPLWLANVAATPKAALLLWHVDINRGCATPVGNSNAASNRCLDVLFSTRLIFDLVKECVGCFEYFRDLVGLGCNYFLLYQLYSSRRDRLLFKLVDCFHEITGSSKLFLQDALELVIRIGDGLSYDFLCSPSDTSVEWLLRIRSTRVVPDRGMPIIKTGISDVLP